MINMMDVMVDQALSAITSNLLIKSTDSFENIKKGLRSLFNNSSLETGMVTFQENELTPLYKSDVRSILLNKNTSLDCKEHMGSKTFKH